MLRVMLVDEKPERSLELERALAEAGYEVVATVTGRDDLREAIERLGPDVIIVDMQSPSRDVLESMRRIHEERPRPIVMFVDETDADSIRSAVRAGVSAYVVDGLKGRSVRPVVEVAIARFQEFQALRSELESARSSLADRKLVERAKGILMRRRNLDEENAYALLRKSAMDRKRKLVEVAREVIAMSELL